MSTVKESQSLASGHVSNSHGRIQSRWMTAPSGDLEEEQGNSWVLSLRLDGAVNAEV